MAPVAARPSITTHPMTIPAIAPGEMGFELPLAKESVCAAPLPPWAIPVRLAIVVRAVTVSTRRPGMVGRGALGLTGHSESELGQEGGELDGVYAAIAVPTGLAEEYTVLSALKLSRVPGNPVSELPV